MSGFDELDIVVSDLVRMESRILPIRTNNAYLLNEFDAFFRTNLPVRMPARAFEQATELRANHGLPALDALHLGCAVVRHCEEFWTNDHRLDRLTLPIRVRVFDD